MSDSAALASRGDRVVLTSRSPEVLERVRQECVARGAGDVLVVPADVRRAELVDEVFDTTASTRPGGWSRPAAPD